LAFAEIFGGLTKIEVCGFRRGIAELGMRVNDMGSHRSNG
jgi:hypothetical protein